MKKKELTEIRTKTSQELTKVLVEKKKEVSLLFSTLKAGKENNSSKRKNLRRDIAQILTILKEKEIAEKESVTKEKDREARK